MGCSFLSAPACRMGEVVSLGTWWHRCSQQAKKKKKETPRRDLRTKHGEERPGLAPKLVYREIYQPGSTRRLCLGADLSTAATAAVATASEAGTAAPAAAAAAAAVPPPTLVPSDPAAALRLVPAIVFV